MVPRHSTVYVVVLQRMKRVMRIFEPGRYQAQVGAKTTTGIERETQPFLSAAYQHQKHECAAKKVSYNTSHANRTVVRLQSAVIDIGCFFHHVAFAESAHEVSNKFSTRRTFQEKVQYAQFSVVHVLLNYCAWFDVIAPFSHIFSQRGVVTYFEDCISRG